MAVPAGESFISLSSLSLSLSASLFDLAGPRVAPFCPTPVNHAKSQLPVVACVGLMHVRLPCVRVCAPEAGS